MDILIFLEQQFSQPQIIFKLWNQMSACILKIYKGTMKAADEKVYQPFVKLAFYCLFGTFNVFFPYT
jgi:hypothetical protein